MADTFHHEPPYSIGVICGSIAASSINRRLANAMMKLAPEDLQCSYIEIDKLGLYNHDLDGDYPPEAQELKRQIESSDGILIVTPEYNRSIPGALKNAIDWHRARGARTLSRGSPSASPAHRRAGSALPWGSSTSRRSCPSATRR